MKRKGPPSESAAVPRGAFVSNLLIKNIRVSLSRLRGPWVVSGVASPVGKTCPGMLNTNSP